MPANWISNPINLDFHYIKQLVSVPGSAIPTHREVGADQRLWYHLHIGKQINWQNDKSVYCTFHTIAYAKNAKTEKLEEL